MACRLWLENEIGIDLSLLFLPYAVRFQRFWLLEGLSATAIIVSL